MGDACFFLARPNSLINTDCEPPPPPLRGIGGFRANLCHRTSACGSGSPGGTGGVWCGFCTLFATLGVGGVDSARYLQHLGPVVSILHMILLLEFLSFSFGIPLFFL